MVEVKSHAGQRYVLYRMFNECGQLLYVGATVNIGLRLRDHARLRPWWDEVARIDLERCDSHDELISKESAAILIEGPKYNTIQMKEPSWAGRSMRPKGDGALFQRSSDGVWVGRVELPPGPDGKRRRRHVTSKDRATAERKLKALRTSINQGS